MKKFLSVLLCLSMLATFCVPAAAVDVPQSSAKSSSKMVLSNNSVMLSEDFSNGDARFTILDEKGSIISESYLQRSEGIIRTESKLTKTSDIRRVPSQEIRATQLTRMATNPYVPSGFTRRGAITYNFYGWTDHVMGTRTLDVYYDYNYYAGSRYNVNGVYQDIASFASLLAALLALPAVVAASFAANILSNLSIATGLVSIFIPDHYVRCRETEITWFAQISDFPDVYASFTGSKFVLTEEGYADTTEYSGDFCPLSDYTNHNANFAVKLYMAVVGQDILEIVSWS